MKTELKLSEFTIEVTKKRIKRMNLRIYPPDGHIKISAPSSLSDAVIIQFAESKLDWIRKNHERVRKRSKQDIHCDNQLESVSIFGEKLKLKFNPYKTSTETNLETAELVLPVSSDASYLEKQKVLKQYYHKKLSDIIPLLIEKWTNVIPVPKPHWQLRAMKTRWGSCTPSTKKIRLNVNLIHKPQICLEYVLAHELVHLLEPSHNKRFYQLMSQYMPDWKIYKKLLEC